MASGKTGIKKQRAGIQSDTNIKQMTMGNNWPTRAMRRSSEGRGASGGKAKIKVKYPPPGGWTAENSR